MKHNFKITLILLAMFFITQLIGLAVINAYLPYQENVVINGTLQNITIKPELPYGMQPPEMKPEISFASIVTAFIIAILLVLLLTAIKAKWFLRIWFFVVIVLAIAITLNPLLKTLPYSAIIALVVALPLAFYKVFRRNLIVHNITELMIYPGIAAIFVPILNVWTIIVLLIIISAYDIYAVWHSGFMQRLAKFQINELKVFAGFFLPYLSKGQRARLKKLRTLKKRKAKKGKKQKEAKFKVSFAILGGGDVVFPIITAGVILRALGFWPALIVSITATLALLGLFIAAKKGKFYPAMPFITIGCIAGIIIAYLV